MDAMTLLADARSAGLSVSVAGGVLRVRGPKQAADIANLLLSRKGEIVPLLAVVPPLFAKVDKPEQVVPLDRNEDFEERAAICEHDGGLSREWAEGLARICTMARPDDILPPRWRSIVDAAGQFVDQWARRAHEVGQNRTRQNLHSDMIFTYEKWLSWETICNLKVENEQI